MKKISKEEFNNAFKEYVANPDNKDALQVVFDYCTQEGIIKTFVQRIF